jgi:hypothetical protein
MSTDSFKVNGIIEDITCHQSPEKIVMTIRPNKHQQLFVEFRGARTKKAVHYKKGQHVEIPIEYEGRKAKSGKPFNNIVGKSIKIHQPNL